MDRRHKTIAHIAFAFAMHRHVHGQHQRLNARIARAAHQVGGDLRVARHIQLVPGVLGCPLCGRFYRCRAGTRQHEGDVGGHRRVGQHQVGARARKPGQAGGANTKRCAIAATQ